MGKGERQSKLGDYEGALDYYQMSLESVTEDHEPMVLYYCLAHTFAKLGRYEEARKYADQSLKDCEKFAGLGQSVQELRQDVNEVLQFVEYMEGQMEDGS
jgi:tetratricopeptide (TPR) repeat protein